MPRRDRSSRLCHPEKEQPKVNRLIGLYISMGAKQIDACLHLQPARALASSSCFGQNSQASTSDQSIGLIYIRNETFCLGVAGTRILLFLSRNC